MKIWIYAKRVFPIPARSDVHTLQRLTKRTTNVSKWKILSTSTSTLAGKSDEIVNTKWIVLKFQAGTINYDMFHCVKNLNRISHYLRHLLRYGVKKKQALCELNV